MRRPRFHRWIRLEAQRLADADSFSLRKLAARAQEPGNQNLAAALFLYAHENDVLGTLMTFVYDDSLAHEFLAIEANVGQRSLERLALRDAPMALLPDCYRAVLAAYKRAYYAPEALSNEKRRLCDIARACMLKRGISPTEVARTLKLDPANTNAFLAHGDVSRFTLDTVHAIVAAVSADGALSKI